MPLISARAGNSSWRGHHETIMRAVETRQSMQGRTTREVHMWWGERHMCDPPRLVGLLVVHSLPSHAPALKRSIIRSTDNEQRQRSGPLHEGGASPATGLDGSSFDFQGQSPRWGKCDCIIQSRAWEPSFSPTPHLLLLLPPGLPVTQSSVT